VGTHRIDLGLKAGIQALELSPDLSVYSLGGGEGEGRSPCLQVWRGKDWESVLSLPGLEHCAMVNVGSEHMAVMASLQEGGFLYIVNLTYKAKVAEMKLKSTQHQGRGLVWVGGRLYLSTSNKLLSLTVTNLQGGLQSLLGITATSSSPCPYTEIPDLISAGDTPGLVSKIQNLQDLPEPLLVQCLVYFLDSEEELRAEAQLCYIGLLVSRDVSEALLEQEVSRLSMEQVVKLLSVLDTLLQKEVAGVECEDTQILSWISLLLNTHYLQLVVAKDPETKKVVSGVQDTVAAIQESARILADTRTLTYNIINTKIPIVKNNNQAYCIEIIQI